MKLGKQLSLGLLVLSSLSLEAAQPIEVRAISYSVLIRPATVKIFGITYLNQVGVYGFDINNGELSLAPEEIPDTHWGRFFFTDGQLSETYGLDFILDIPLHDANHNGMFDLLEYGVSDSGRTDGEYVDPEGNFGTFRADWSKAADSMNGTVRITFDFMGQAFVHPFEILSYYGEISSLTRNGADVTAEVTLARQGLPESIFVGPLKMTASPGEIALTSTFFRTETGAKFEWFAPEVFERDGNEFFQILGVFDGTPPDWPEDYNTWLLWIIDRNDDDGDGIPNLIDTAAPLPAAPTIEIIKTAEGVRLLIHAELGRTFTLEDTAAISPTVWQHPTAITPTADPHIVDLPAGDAALFWRLRFP